MHELAITQQILDTILTTAREQGMKRITKVNLELGTMTSFKEDPITFYFHALKKGQEETSGADIHIKIIPAMIECKACKEKNNIEEMYQFFCPSCESSNIEVIQGKDLKIISIEGE